MTFKTFLQKIFSIKNLDKHKVITFFGIKIKFKHEIKVYPVVHFSAFTRGNAGDYILVYALQHSIEKITRKKIKWIDFFVHNKIDNNIEKIINSSNLMLVGGGGLFLKDTNPNNISGWQLPITLQNLDNIRVPIYMLAVGYNRFRNQPDFEPYFKDNINAFTQKAQIIGLRNYGSIKAMNSYLESNLKNKVIFHPCPTTILKKLFKFPKIKTEKPFIAINCAFDRSIMRYNENKDAILYSIARVTKKLSKDYAIKYYIHVETDSEALSYFDKEKINYETIHLNKDLTIQDILELYSAPELVIGMRGHAQMVPFGCETPILSIISHDKMAWFLEDIKHTEWGVDILSPTFEKDLYEKAIYILNNKTKIQKQIRKAQNILYDITVNNIKKLNLALKDTTIITEEIENV